MNKKILTQIQNAEIDIRSYDPSSRALPTTEEVNQRRESLLKLGLINPIIVTDDENHNPLIVDGYLRYKLIRELKEQNKWSDFPLDVLEITLDIQTSHKNYTKIQLAIFGAYNYWDEVEKNSLLRQKQGKKVSGNKGKTAKIVGNMSGVNEKYAQYAHILLSISRNFFYKIFFISRLSIKKAEIEDLIAINSNYPEHAKEIVTEMKKIFVRESILAGSNAQKNIYERAKKTWENNTNAPAEKLIGKLTASKSETEEVKNVLFTKGTNIGTTISTDSYEKPKENPSINMVNECDSNIIDFNEVTKKLNVTSCTSESVETKTLSSNKTLCIITSSQPLPDFVSLHLKHYIETNSNYTVEIQQIYDTENI